MRTTAGRLRAGDLQSRRHKTTERTIDRRRRIKKNLAGWILLLLLLIILVLIFRPILVEWVSYIIQKLILSI